MNQRLKELMIEAGYAAPEIASRANKLAELVALECCSVLEKWKVEPFPFDEDVAISLIKEHFDIPNRNNQLFSIIKNSDKKLLGPEEC